MHHWQDIILASGQFVFSAALIPSVISKNKPSFWTSFPTGVVLAIFGLTYLTLHLWFAAGATFVSATIWLVLAAQKKLQKE